MAIKVGVTGYAETMQKLAAMNSKGGKIPSKLADVIGAHIVAATKRAFVKQQDPMTGAAWKPLGPRSRKGVPLRDTGRLMASISAQPTASGVIVGTNLIYAATHQFGDPKRKPKRAKYLRWSPRGSTAVHFAKKVSIPQRRFLPVSDKGGQLAPSVQTALNKAMANWFQKVAS